MCGARGPWAAGECRRGSHVRCPPGRARRSHDHRRRRGTDASVSNARAACAGADLSTLGITRSRAATLHALARGVLEGRIDFGAAPAELVTAMAALPGIGPWTAQYVLMRALAEPDALPTADLVLRRMAAPTKVLLSGRQLDERSRSWQPWRGYAVLHLWRAAAGAGVAT